VDGTPLPSIEVVAYRLESSPDMPPYVLGDAFIRFTEADGSFRIYLEPGFYVVGVGPEPRQWWQDKTAPQIADPLEVTTTGGVEGIVFRLPGSQ
jgi:hypothetical protein